MKIENKHSIILRENLPLFVFLLVSFFAIFGLAWSNFYVSGDTIVLINSLKAISSCLENKKFDYCAAIAHFPLSQHLVGFIFLVFGAEFENLIYYFKGLNLFAWLLGLLLPLLYWKDKKYRSHLLVYFIVYLSSPLWWYGNASFNEILTATLISLFLLSLMHGTYFPLITSFLVVLTKEIAFVYVAAWTIAIGYLRLKENKSQVKTAVLSSILGAVLGLIVQILFNLWRFKSAINAELLLPIYRVPSFDIKLDFFFAQWIGPNVGVLLFWPGLAILLTIYFLFFKEDRQWYFSRLTVAVFLFSLTIGFASWCAPFGWISYGHRLIVPWLPGLALFILYSTQNVLVPILKKISSNVFFKYSITAAIMLLTIPNITILFSSGISIFFNPDSVCPTTAILQTDAKYYYDCIRHYAWSANWIHFVTLSNADWTKAAPATLIGLTTIGVLLKKMSKVVSEN